MAQTDYDVIINGTKAKVLRMEDGYLKRYVRREIDLQLLNQADTPAIASRGDTPAMYQTSWAGGATWWKPLLQGKVDTYFTARGLDAWSEPGKLVPSNKWTAAAITGTAVGAIANGDYLIGSTKVVDATMFDVFRWNAATEAYIQETGYSSGIGSDDAGLKIAFDPNDSYYYVITDDSHIERFQPSGSLEDTDWIITGFTQYPGCNIFLQNEELMMYSGDKLYTIDKGVPSVTQVFNDGMGPEMMNGMGQGGSQQLAYKSQITLAVSTPQGVYYVKNTNQGGKPAPWVFRVNKNAAGQWIGEPIAELPAGSMALSVAWHLGSLIIATTPDAGAALTNQGGKDYYEVIFYHVTNDTMGAIGSMFGARDLMITVPFKIVGSDGPFLYICDWVNLFVYDAVRGGIHHAGVVGGGNNIKGPFSHFNITTDADGDSINLLVGDGESTWQKRSGQDDPNQVSSFDTDLVKSVITSNYWDGNIPMELKELTKVAIQHDPIDQVPNQQFTVQVSVDDGSFATVLKSGTVAAIFKEAALKGKIGYRFQYKIAYETKDIERLAVRSLLFTFATGVMVPEWEMTLDGTEFLNIDNEVQDPLTFRTALETIAGTEAIITLVDNYQDGAQEVDSATTTDVKVQAIQISKDAPDEAKIRVVLRGV